MCIRDSIFWDSICWRSGTFLCIRSITSLQIKGNSLGIFFGRTQYRSCYNWWRWRQIYFKSIKLQIYFRKWSSCIRWRRFNIIRTRFINRWTCFLIKRRLYRISITNTIALCVKYRFRQRGRFWYIISIRWYIRLYWKKSIWRWG